MLPIETQKYLNVVRKLTQTYRRAVCGESRKHGSEGGSWKSAVR